MYHTSPQDEIGTDAIVGLHTFCISFKETKTHLVSRDCDCVCVRVCMAVCLLFMELILTCSNQFKKFYSFSVCLYSIDIIDGCGRSDKDHLEHIPKKTKVTLNFVYHFIIGSIVHQ